MLRYHRYDVLIFCRKSASCTHVSALLHALVSMTASQFQLHPKESPSTALTTDEESQPVTSLPCQWKPPRKRKESTLPLSEASFEKHEFSKEKRKVKLLEDFDPRPVGFRGHARERLPELLEKIRGEQLCVSLLFDETFRFWDSSPSGTTPTPPDDATLRRTVEEFKASLNVSEQVIRKIENDTRQQRNSPLWYSVRRYRITASVFGNILRRKPSTPPDSLVLSILQPRVFTSAAIEWGVQQEATAIQQYVTFQQCHGHSDTYASPCGFHVSKSLPYLGATPDGAVFYPSNL